MKMKAKRVKTKKYLKKKKLSKAIAAERKKMLASRKQRELMTRFKIPFKKDITIEVASRRIEAFLSEREKIKKQKKEKMLLCSEDILH